MFGQVGVRSGDNLGAKKARIDQGHFQVGWHFPCGSGFPAATIEAESLSQKNLLADNVTSGVMPC
jgi:hypothetical protein